MDLSPTDWYGWRGQVKTYLQTELPIDPSSLTRWRKRVGEEGVETLLAASIDAARRGGVIKNASVQQVIVDTTVMPKAIAHPTDSRLLERNRQHLVKASEGNGLKLHQNYNRIAPRLAAQIGRYAHAKQFKRMKKAVRTLRTRVGRLHREVQRQMHVLPEAAKAKVQDLLQRTGRILTQRTKDKNKLYALHAPEVECISKGKARTPYEFGVKVSIATTLKKGLVVGMRSMPGNPYDADVGPKAGHHSNAQGPAPHITACSASPSAPLSGLRPSRPSIFMCPMAGSMALRRLIWAQPAPDPGRAAALLRPIRAGDAGAHRRTAGRTVRRSRRRQTYL